MLSIVTMNIRYPAREDGVHCFPFRLPHILEKISSEQPDILCFQEMLPEMYEAIACMLPAYGFIGIGREQDLAGESCRIAYKKSVLSLCATDTCWLSPTPNLPGSRYPGQSPCPRVCTYGKFYHRAGRQMLYVVNTHLDHEGDGARKRGLQQVLSIAAALSEREPHPVFITGDFNFTPHDAAYAMIAASPFNDISDTIRGSFHGFGNVEDAKIDYILTDRPKNEFMIDTWHAGKDGTLLSDHDFLHATWSEI